MQTADTNMIVDRTYIGDDHGTASPIEEIPKEADDVHTDQGTLPLGKLSNNTTVARSFNDQSSLFLQEGRWNQTPQIS